MHLLTLSCASILQERITHVYNDIIYFITLLFADHITSHTKFYDIIPLFSDTCWLYPAVSTSNIWKHQDRDSYTLKYNFFRRMNGLQQTWRKYISVAHFRYILCRSFYIFDATNNQYQPKMGQDEKKRIVWCEMFGHVCYYSLDQWDRLYELFVCGNICELSPHNESFQWAWSCLLSQ